MKNLNLMTEAEKQKAFNDLIFNLKKHPELGLIKFLNPQSKRSN
jgi:hypothetical protein